MGLSGNCWGAVSPRVAARTATVAYDRSGLGRSPTDPARRDLARLIGDLVDVLDEVAGPVVLVGFSWGGPIVRGAAAQRPERIAGLVLVDPTDELCAPLVSAANERLERWTRPLTRFVGRLGAARLLAKRQAVLLPEPAATRFRAEEGTPAALRAYSQEVATSIVDVRRLLDDPWPVPDVPVTIVSGGRGAGKPNSRRAALIAAHAQRTDGLALGRHVLAPDSAHLVPFTDPEIVATEVLRVVDAIR